MLYWFAANYSVSQVIVWNLCTPVIGYGFTSNCPSCRFGFALFIMWRRAKCTGGIYLSIRSDNVDSIDPPRDNLSLIDKYFLYFTSIDFTVLRFFFFYVMRKETTRFQLHGRPSGLLFDACLSLMFNPMACGTKFTDQDQGYRPESRRAVRAADRSCRPSATSFDPATRYDASGRRVAPGWCREGVAR